MKSLLFLCVLMLFARCQADKEPEDLHPLPDSVLAIVTSDPSSVVISRQRPVVAGSLLAEGSSEGNLTGYTERNPEMDVAVSPLFSGRIEKMHVRSIGEQVTKGQILFEYYSPEINTLQEQLRLAVREGESQQVEQLTARLLILQVPQHIIRQVKNGKIVHALPYYAPVSGFLFLPEGTDSKAGQPVAMDNNGSGSMNMSAPRESNRIKSTTVAGQLPVAESYFVKGQKLFDINSLSNLWIRFYMPPSAVPLRQGRVQVGTTSGTSYVAEISKVEPVLREGDEFIAVRAVIPNLAGKITIGELVTINDGYSQATSGLQVPSSALLDLGNRIIAWKLTRSDTTKGIYVYTAKEVAASPGSGGVWQVQSGLTPDERIAPAAGFMTDVQSLIQVKP